MDVIAIDLDGTLLTREGTVSQANLEALHAARKSGFLLVAATGRSPVTRPSLRVLDSIFDYWIWFNGALATCSAGTKVLFEARIDFHELGIFQAAMDWNEFGLVLFSRTCVYACSPSNPVVLEYAVRRHLSVVKLPASRFDFLANTSLYKFFVYPRSARMRSPNTETLHRVARVIPAVFCAVPSAHSYLACSIAGVSKWRGIEEIVAGLNQPVARSLAIGNDLNDVEMLVGATVGAAVEDAHPRAKHVADLIVPHHEASGVAVAIRTFLAMSQQS